MSNSRSRGVSVQNPKKLSLDPLADPRSLPRAPSQVAEVRFATATLKARASPVEQITKGIDARADLHSVEPSPEWRSPPAQMETGKWRRPCADRGPSAYPYRRRQSAVFQRGRAGQRPTVTAAGHCKRAICHCSNRSRQQPWRPRRWQSGARRIRPCWGRSIQWN